MLAAAALAAAVVAGVSAVGSLSDIEVATHQGHQCRQFSLIFNTTIVI